MPSSGAINLWSTDNTQSQSQRATELQSYRATELQSYTQTEISRIVKIVYLESSLAQGITVEMELNIYSQFHR